MKKQWTKLYETKYYSIEKKVGKIYINEKCGYIVIGIKLNGNVEQKIKHSWRKK